MILLRIKKFENGTRQGLYQGYLVHLERIGEVQNS